MQPTRPTMLERAQELAENGECAFFYQIERRLVEEGYPAAAHLKAAERNRLRAILKITRS